jgi:hypothetical protein
MKKILILFMFVLLGCNVTKPIITKPEVEIPLDQVHCHFGDTLCVYMEPQTIKL